MFANTSKEHCANGHGCLWSFGNGFIDLVHDSDCAFWQGPRFQHLQVSKATALFRECARREGCSSTFTLKPLVEIDSVLEKLENLSSTLYVSLNVKRIASLTRFVFGQESLSPDELYHTYSLVVWQAICATFHCGLRDFGINESVVFLRLEFIRLETKTCKRTTKRPKDIFFLIEDGPREHFCDWQMFVSVSGCFKTFCLHSAKTMFMMSHGFCNATFANGRGQVFNSLFRLLLVCIAVI